MAVERLLSFVETDVRRTPHPGEAVAPPEMMGIAEGIPPVPRSAFLFLADRFQEYVPSRELYSFGMGLPLVGNWASHLEQNILRVRHALPEEYAVYHLHGFFRYTLDWRRRIGSWFVPPHRAQRVETMPLEIQPLMRFCHQVQVMDDKRLRSRLNPNELAAALSLGRAYPDAISSTKLSDGIWGLGTAMMNRENLWVMMSRVREKVRGFEGTPCEIVADNGGYRLTARSSDA